MDNNLTLTDVYNKLLNIPGYYVTIGTDGSILENDFEVCKPALSRRGFQVHLIPGSFNPLHESHCEIYTNALKYLPTAGADRNALVCFEMSIVRIDKPPVTFEQFLERVAQFRGYAPVAVSNAARFVSKIGTYIAQAEKITFHVGIDCITRMQYDYGLVGIQGLAAEFIVYDRIIDDKLMRLESDFANFTPRNCRSANLIRTRESLIRSSTAIRNQTK